MLTVIDEFTRRCMAVVVRRLNSDNVLHCLPVPQRLRVYRSCRPDWLGRIVRDPLYREERIQREMNPEHGIFYTLKEAKVPRWRHHYNTIRPRLGYRPPAPETILPNVRGANLPLMGYGWPINLTRAKL